MRALLSVACMAVLLPSLAVSTASAADLDYEYAAPPVAPPQVYERREVLPPPPPVVYDVPVRPYYRPYPRFYPTYVPRPYRFHRPFVRPYGFEGYGYGYRRYGY